MSEPSSEPATKQARTTKAASTTQAQSLSYPQPSLPFDMKALAKALDSLFDEPRTEVMDVVAKYKVDGSFGGRTPKVHTAATKGGAIGKDKCMYWMDEVRPGRFDITVEEGLLYRPEIVKGILEKMAMEAGHGVKVEGPQGVGKSHSLVNVVRKLESTSNYLVTFIPDCETWDDIGELYDFICRSMGSTRMELRLDSGNQNTRKDNLNVFINAVDEILVMKKKKWVFVFDEINKLFIRFPKIKQLGAFKFPYNQIHKFLRRGLRTCVISEPANNETMTHEDQDGFMDYNYPHPLKMKEDELRLAFAELEDASNLQSLIELTGGVPWQVHRRLQLKADEDNVVTKRKAREARRIAAMKIDKANRAAYIKDLGKNFCTFPNETIPSIDTRICKALINKLDMKFPRPSSQKLDEMYTDNEHGHIRATLDKLKEENGDGKSEQWKSIVKAAISCLMNLETTADKYDRKSSVWEKRSGQNRLYMAVHPLVLDAYQEYFWDDLMKYVHDEEAELLKVCNMPETTHVMMGQIFKWLVIQRCRQGQLSTGTLDVHLPKESFLVQKFHTQHLPEVMLHDGMYVPVNGSFPAIDLLWKSGKTVWGVQVHVNVHKEVLNRFAAMCTVAKWDTTMDNVYLVYLSPNRDVAKLSLKSWNEKQAKSEPPHPWVPKVQVLCCEDIECLKNMQ